ncbi:hypothetical protein V1260_00055 [Brachybacterium sp. J144]|uniref:hypothetical protein n=1 Tax=Brachybacterium sp. J144 TaxID=3116487 RepID=UPI002E78FA57|nr:hypothetical protein [Brachybacterium sp. J144]MEE1649178.1 hypothetical protein [Brachybacterium sp. J144]
MQGADRDPGAGGDTSRRRVLHGTGALAALAALGGGGYALGSALGLPHDPRTVVPLSSATVALAADGTRVPVGGQAGAAALHPGTRLLADVPAGSAPARRAEEFLAGAAAWRDRITGASDPTGSTDLSAPSRSAPKISAPELADSALWDLWILSDGLVAPVAGWTSKWRYIWPRDTAFSAVALARVGHLDRALDALEHLQRIQPATGWYEARYVPGTDRAPDDRPPQFDGTGLVLWAVSEVVEVAGERRGEVLDRLARLVTTSAALLLEETADGRRPPPVSPDYWEVRERRVTAGILAATLAGLRAAATLTQEDRVVHGAEAFAALTREDVAVRGVRRYRRGGGADSGAAFLDATGHHDLLQSTDLLGLRGALARPAGGIAPGASWKQDGISWTPSTSLLALALARRGEHEAAGEILDWLAAHRTEAGSLPEKVLFDGRPAALAPLAWTAANVLLACDAQAGTGSDAA